MEEPFIGDLFDKAPGFRERIFISAVQNIGFEIHGNYDYTVDIKDFQLTSYRLKIIYKLE